MRGMLRLLLGAVGAVVLLALAATAAADPGEPHADEIPVPPPGQPKSPPGSENVQLLDVADKDGTINSDIAFYGNLAFVGNYDGFRIIDISNPSSMNVLSDTTCRANQGDVSVFKGQGRRLYMLQSIDRPVDAPDCSAKDTPLVKETDEFGVQWDRAKFGYEGLRLFDVTDPRHPRFVRFFRTECGSHTHSLVPDRKAVHAYVASYPLLSQITPQEDLGQAGALACDAPHQKISIVSLPLSNPKKGVVRKQALSEDTEPYDHDGPAEKHTHDDGTEEWHGTAPAFQACHDHQAFMARRIVVASCAGDLQYWKIGSSGTPSADDEGRHTHIQREVREDDPSTEEDERLESFDFMHNATVTWDGKLVAAVDEAGGGVAARCDGSETKRGFTFFYPLVEPGAPVDGFKDLKGRYVIPRPQGDEVCVSHNGNVLPRSDGRYQQVQAFYQGGNSFLDFTNPAAPEELGFADLEDAFGQADSWSTYWYNDVMYVNGGLNRRTSNRGFEAYALLDDSGQRVTTRRWAWSNPQTQEAWQAP